MNKHANVVIIIVNWNGYKDTIECLTSLKKLSYKNLSTIIVDNGSTDKSVYEIETAFPDINILKLSTNIGFTGGSNAGIQAALDMHADYIFLLNNDTLIDNKLLVDSMVEYSEKHKDVGILSPVVLKYPEGTISFGGGNLDRNTGIIKLDKTNDKYISSSIESARMVNFIYGCSLFIKVDLLKKVDGFYEPYFLTSEESELCVKALDLGYKLVLLEHLYLYHKVSQSMVHGSFLWAYFLYRNKLFFIKRNAKAFSLADLIKVIIYYLRNLAGCLRMRNYSAATGIIRGVLDFALGREGKGYFEGKL